MQIAVTSHKRKSAFKSVYWDGLWEIISADEAFLM